MKLVRLYSLKGCPNCDAARAFFAQNSIEVEDIEIGTDPVLHSGIKSMTNGQLMAPVIIPFVGSDIVFGFQPERLQEFVTNVNSLRQSSSKPSDAPAQ